MRHTWDAIDVDQSGSVEFPEFTLAIFPELVANTESKSASTTPTRQNSMKNVFTNLTMRGGRSSEASPACSSFLARPSRLSSSTPTPPSERVDHSPTIERSDGQRPTPTSRPASGQGVRRASIANSPHDVLAMAAARPVAMASGAVTSSSAELAHLAEGQVALRRQVEELQAQIAQLISLVADQRDSHQRATTPSKMTPC